MEAGKSRSMLSRMMHLPESTLHSEQERTADLLYILFVSSIVGGVIVCEGWGQLNAQFFLVHNMEDVIA